MLWKSLMFASIFASTSTFADLVTIEGEIIKIVPSKKEIYVEQDDREYEFYFTEQTTYKKGTANAKFEDLKQGMTVKVVADKIGKRYDPKSVQILK